MIPALAAAFACFILTVAGTRAAIAWLLHRRYLDHPNERSSHSAPTPRGGGLAVTPAILLCWAGWRLATGGAAPLEWALMAGAALLMALSWWDDRHTLAAGPRFAVHALAVAAGLWVLPEGALVFQGWLPVWADRLLAGLGWLWFLNLTNFMDGIDGITGVETAAIGIGLLLLGGAGGGPGLIAAAAGLGFLVWNWHPARIFLGDSGSIPLGFILGGLLLQLAAEGHLAAALILPAYYVADATITITRRLLNREKIWQAHRKHFYQRAVQGGRSHSQVTQAILAGNAVLVLAALMAASGQVLAGAVTALAVVAALLAILQVWSKGRPA
ncbi:UDP-N-acetylmuramyl pentapeptide phosphotransferase [Paramagnetospirillum caucaseum]|uniref:UDP-N-acetylmuramyl pentapeptide phosphotransferase n=1 Tax=Paramagnetospirillum caucaseum TaxID=1244869 RepID=M2Z441_9PROT|nr:glycosyltransferase family 4 protein [Paramagnetospirillum caucaseum]EME69135.1 UDP-N-acetylmuramyl pentapeptide phosphotransferase [Paramagnetospirillum caucaseum]